MFNKTNPSLRTLFIITFTNFVCFVCFTGLDFLADGGADFEHAITVTGKKFNISINISRNLTLARHTLSLSLSLRSGGPIDISRKYFFLYLLQFSRDNSKCVKSKTFFDLQYYHKHSIISIAVLSLDFVISNSKVKNINCSVYK